MSGWEPGLSAVLTILMVMTSVLSALLERSGPIRLSHWVEEAGGRLRALFEKPRQFTAFRVLLNVVASVVPVALVLVVTLMPGRPGPWWWPILGVTLLAGVLELVNQRLVRSDSELALQRLTRFYVVALVLSWPLLPLLALVVPNGDVDRREEEEDEASEQEIAAYIDVGTREGILDDQDSELLRSVVDFGDTWVRSVMTPRIDMLCAAVDSSLDELAEVFIESTHSRLPLYDQSIDNIVGVLHIRDLLRALKERPSASARELAKAVWFVPESKPLDEVLKELQERRQQLAVVVDEYGGTSGLVTIEDLLEEIVGDIVDQDEELPPQILRQPDGSWVLDGRIRLDELTRTLSLDLEEDAVDTVGGMLFSAFGYVPEKGESIEVHGRRFTVQDVQDRRIQTVLVVDPVPQEVLDGD